MPNRDEGGGGSGGLESRDGNGHPSSSLASSGASRSSSSSSTSNSSSSSIALLRGKLDAVGYVESLGGPGSEKLVSKLLNDVLLFEGKYREAVERVTTTTEAFERLNATHEDLRKRSADSSRVVSDCRSTLKRKEDELADFLAAFQAQGNENDKLRKTVERLEKALKEGTRSAKAAEARTTEMLAYIEDLELQNGGFVTDLRGYERQVDALTRELRLTEEKLVACERKLGASASETGELHEALEALQLRMRHREEEMVELREEVELLRSHLADAETEREAARRAQLEEERKSAVLNERLKAERADKALAEDAQGLSSMVEAQQRVIETLEDEKAKLKEFICRYECELSEKEERIQQLEGVQQEAEGTARRKATMGGTW